MVKNTKGGNKARKSKNTQTVDKKKLPIAEGPLQFYAKVESPLGNRNFSVKLLEHENQDLSQFSKSDNIFDTMYIGHLRGSIRKGRWVKKGDLIIISLRSFNLKDNKVDIINVYSHEESKYIIRTRSVVIDKNNDNGYDDVVFAEEKKVLPKKKKNISANYMDGIDLPSESDDEYLEEEILSTSNTDKNDKNNSEEEKINEEIDFDEI